MGYDDWKTKEPDEPWSRGQKCATRDCDNFVTFPDFEDYCTNCLVDRQQKQIRELELANAAAERRR